MCFASASRRLAISSSVYPMGFDFRGILRRLRARFELSRLQAQLALFQWLASSTAKLQERFPTRQISDPEAIIRQTVADRNALFMAAGQALSQWVIMEELLIGVAGLLLRPVDHEKIGIIMYSIQFSPFVGIVEDLFLQDPIYHVLKPK